jgi:FkbM family methyltransferase
MRNILKTIWKSIMKVLVRIYTGDLSLYVQNNPKNLDQKKFYSQFGQDTYAFEHIFKNKKEGLFIDVGANYPIEGSNTYLLELNGWTGIAIEPQEKLRKLWPATRKTTCLPYVIGPENKMVDFIEGCPDEHGLAGVMGYNKIKVKHQIKQIEQRRLDDVLLENNVLKVDFLSIDVEGYEMNVLESIDFNKVDIQVICLENDINFSYIPFIGKKIGSELGNNTIRKYLKNKGYKHVARIVCDDFFIKE